MSKHSIQAGDVEGLLGRVCSAQGEKRERGRGGDSPIIAIQEAGIGRLSGSIRVPQSEGIESHVVDAASILIFVLDSDERR